MTTGFYYCCDFLHTAVRVWMTLQLIGAVAEPKLEKKIEAAAHGAVILGIAAMNTYNHTMSGSLFSNGMLFLIMLILTIVGGFFYRLLYRRQWILIFYFWESLVLSDFFIQTLVYILLSENGGPTDILLTTSVYRGIYLLVYALVIIWVGNRIRHWLSKNREYIWQYLKWMYLFLIPVVICMVYFQRIYRMHVTDQLMSHWWIFILGCVLVILLAGVYAIKQREEERFLLQQQKVNLLEGNYQLLSNVYEEKSVLLHDMRKHIGTIRGLAEEDQWQDLLKYVTDIDGTLREQRSRDLANHKLLNLILNIKLQEAEAAGIEVQYEFDDMNGLVLRPVDVCALFSNLLDNAIEANKKREDGRWLKLSCMREGQMMVLSTSNAMVHSDLNLDDGLPQTTKKDKKMHGFGMQSIRQVVRTYDGYMKVETKEEVFFLSIYLVGFDFDKKTG